jgi:ABC-type transport system involved in multi-copper enzyme maturation permease subunit
MLWLIIKKEYLLNLISLRFAIAFALASILTLLSVYILVDDYRSRLKEYGQRVASHAEQLNSAYSYADLLDDDIVVDKEPARLSVLVQGIERNISPVVKFKKGDYPVLSEFVSDNPLFSLFRKIDFLFVVQYILSLMALFFAYDNISGEKESGTFKLTFSNAVPRDTILLGKVIGGFSCLMTPLAFAFLASLVLIKVRGVSFSGEDYLRAGSIFLASVLFLLCLYTLGIMVSAATKSSVTSLFVLLFIWTILVFNIPPLSQLTAKRIFAAPEYSSILSASVNINQETQSRIVERIIKQNVESETPPTVQQMYEIIRDEKEAGAGRLKRVLEHHEGELRAQIEGALRFSRLSPVAAFANCAMQLGNTGLEEQYNFIDSVRRYQNGLFSYIDGIEKKDKPVKVGELPHYAFQRVGLEKSIAETAVDLGALALFTAFFFAIAYYLFLRYDLR